MKKDVADVLENARAYERFLQLPRVPQHIQWLDHRIADLRQRLIAKLGEDGFDAVTVLVHLDSSEECVAENIDRYLSARPAW